MRGNWESLRAHTERGVKMPWPSRAGSSTKWCRSGKAASGRRKALHRKDQAESDQQLMHLCSSTTFDRTITPIRRGLSAAAREPTAGKSEHTLETDFRYEFIMPGGASASCFGFSISPSSAGFNSDENDLGCCGLLASGSSPGRLFSVPADH